MKIVHITGNTYTLKGFQLMLIYKLNTTDCILIDTGNEFERDELIETLEENHLNLKGIIVTHAHTDHCGNAAYLQKKYQAPVIMSLAEAGLSCSYLGLKTQFPMFTRQEIRMSAMLSSVEVVPDIILMPSDDHLELCGVTFDILPIPGHSTGQIGVRTPDDVLFLADALLAGDTLKNARLPYDLSISDTIKTQHLLKEVKASYYVPAHEGIFTDIQELLDENINLLHTVAGELLSVIDTPLTLPEINQAFCQSYLLRSQNPVKLSLYQRSIRSFFEYLLDKGFIECIVDHSIQKYTKVLSK